MRIAIVGAGLAGLTSARQAIDDGHEVEIFERFGSVGGIWNPNSGGAYPSVRMQSSRMSFPFAAFPAQGMRSFPTLDEVHGYLRDYATDAGLDRIIRFEDPVSRMAKRSGEWHVESRAGEVRVDAVMLATGELWTPTLPSYLPERPGCTVLTAKSYRQPEAFAGKRVLVVGGGVSGADIASELVGHAASVSWSVRKRALFLPREWEGVYNDDLFSYVARIAVGEMPYADYLALLHRIMPSYMAMYTETGLLPSDGFNNAVHVNERIVPLVHAGAIDVVPAFRRFDPDGRVVLADDGTRTYDAVILCMGYTMADYGFVEGFRHERLYEHFVYADDPTLAVINTPVDTDAYGTACPYFEAIAGWVLAIFDGRVTLPSRVEMGRWCEEHMGALTDKRFYDCWLETIRLRLLTGTLPSPEGRFDDYWSVIASRVAPSRLIERHPLAPAAFDAEMDMADLKARVLASLPVAARDRALAEGRISASEHAASAAVPSGRIIPPHLPYRAR